MRRSVDSWASQRASSAATSGAVKGDSADDFRARSFEPRTTPGSLGRIAFSFVSPETPVRPSRAAPDLSWRADGWTLRPNAPLFTLENLFITSRRLP
jgi:hypothetical protein